MNMSELTQAIWTSWEESDVAGAPVFSVEGENVPDYGDFSFSFPLQFQKNASSFTLLVDFSAMELSGLPSDLMAEIPDLTDSEVGMKASLSNGMLFWGTNLPEVDDMTFFVNSKAWSQVWDLLVQFQSSQLDMVTGELPPEEFAETLMTLMDAIMENPDSEAALTGLGQLLGNELVAHATLSRSDLGDNTFRYSASLGDLLVDMLYGGLEKLPWQEIIAKLEASIPEDDRADPEAQAVLKWLKEDLPHYPKSKYQAFADALAKGVDVTLQYDFLQREDGSLFSTAWLFGVHGKGEAALKLAMESFVDAALDFVGDVLPEEEKLAILAMKEGIQDDPDFQELGEAANLGFTMSMATPDGLDFRPVPETAFAITEEEKETADDVSMQVAAFLPLVEMVLRESMGLAGGTSLLSEDEF